ncbi:MAG: hypothetical protein KAT90_15635, partial [Gammaproteobacteria bacterium]|nr:hypothetical protein [Gammaproteobacteria bacterium]
IILPDVTTNDFAFENALISYRSGMLTEDEFYLILRFYSFHHEAYDPAAHILDASIVFEAIRQKYNNGKLSNDEYKIFEQRRGALKHTVYRETEQLNLLTEAFGKTTVIFPNDSCIYQGILNMYSISGK